MSVPHVQNAPVFPTTLTEVLARARKAEGQNVDEKVYAALTAHADTASWLEAMRPFAFVKGAAVKAVPPAKSKWDVKARDVIIRAIFASAKNVRGAQLSIPGIAGKVKTSPDDMLDPAVMYGLSSGGVDLTGLAALADLRSIGYGIDDQEVDAQAKADEAQRHWAHGEHELASVDADLRDLGIHADTADEALHQLALMDHQDGDLLSRLMDTDQDNVTRDYGTFRATAWYAADRPRGRTIRPKVISTRVKQSLTGAIYITGTWDALQIPRPLKAEAFDRLVTLFEQSLARWPITRVVAANTDDLVGKAAIMAAKRIGMHTVAVQVAGWDFKPARMQAQYCETLPTGKDADLARAELDVFLAELVGGAITLGNQDDVLVHNVTRQGKKVLALDPTWVKHNGLY